MEATADNELIWKENNAENRYVSVAQSAVNQEVCGSSPPRDDESVFYLEMFLNFLNCHLIQTRP